MIQELVRRNAKLQKQVRNNTKLKLIVLFIFVLGLLIVAALASYLVPYDPYEQDLNNALQPPDRVHILGTDRYGRDLLSRVIMGAQTTIYSALFLVAFITVIGTAIGMVCGYYGGILHSVVMRIADIFLAFPGMVFAIAVAGVTGGGILNAIIALACISWPKFARLSRSQVIMMKNMDYIAAARLAGSSTGAIMIRHILPNIIGSVLITAVLDIGTMIMELAGLSFLGLGAASPTAEWGSMMSNGRSMIQTAPWVILAPGAAIFITVVLFNLLGDTVRDVLDPKQKKVNG